MQRFVSRIAGQHGRTALRLLIVLGFGLSLGACDKCHIPTWPKSSADGVPLSCHSDAPL
jgi:hypothetical protein